MAGVVTIVLALVGAMKVTGLYRKAVSGAA
jgi:hypothetical protein